MKMTCQYPLIHNNPLLHHLRAYLVHLKVLSTLWFYFETILSMYYPNLKFETNISSNLPYNDIIKVDTIT